MTRSPSLAAPDERPARAPALPRFIQRQPLLDGELRVLGHELSIDPRGPVPVLPGADSAQGNRDELLLASVLDLDYQQALAHRLTLLNLSEAGLGSELLTRLPTEGTLLAPRPEPATPALLARAQDLARRGYALALDEAALTPGLAPLARLCRYLRVDVGDHDLAALADRLTRIEGLRGPRLIARHVETEESFAACRRLSFQLYQGYFFTRPRPASGHAPDPGRLAIMALLNLVAGGAEAARIEARLKTDAALALRLLRYINSPAVGLRYPVRSLGHALLMLGHDQLYRWLTFLLFSSDRGDDRARALFRTALIRARLAEELGGKRLTADLRGGLFLVGILSILDALLNVPMSQALANLRLPQAVLSALLAGQGLYAPYLALARACENFDQDGIARLAGELGLAADEVNLAHVNALIWSESLDI